MEEDFRLSRDQAVERQIGGKMPQEETTAMEVEEPPQQDWNVRLQGSGVVKLKGLQEEEWELGIDEAGRGPVLGPMVYGACFVASSNNEALKKSGFADSKTLTEEKREQLFRNIKECEYLGWMVTVLSAKELSGGMLQSARYNLNAISHDTAIDLVKRAIAAGVNLKKVFVDTVGDPERYEAKLSALFPSIQFTVRKKADSLFPIVSAASICAKVTRDNALRTFAFAETGINISTDFGSGYPGDARTKDWLRQNCDSVFGFPSNVRFSWSTTTALLKDNGHAFEWEADQEEEEANQSKLMSFMTAPQGASKHTHPSVCTYFNQRSLHTVSQVCQ